MIANKQDIINQTLADLNLEHYRHTLAKSLSGGNQRKLN